MSCNWKVMILNSSFLFLNSVLDPFFLPLKLILYHLPIPDLILKLYTFNILLFDLFPLQRTKLFPFNARATERIKNLSIIF